MVPIPAMQRATPTSSPVRSGTRMVAQDIAKACCKPKVKVLSAPFFG